MSFCPSEIFGFVIVIIALLGLCVGSFLNVCIYRVPRHESVVFPASHCPGCGTKIKWYDNIPILSFILLRGKCRHCNEKISLRYPLVEGLNLFFWLLVFLTAGSFVQCFFGCLFSSLLICISAADLDSMEIPDAFNLAVLVLAVMKFGVYLLDGVSLKALLIDFFAGALSGSLLLLGLYLLVLKVLKKEGLGGGDVKLTFACGAFLGWKQVLFGIGLSAYVGLIVVIIHALVKRKSLKDSFPYGPFLSTGFFISYLFFDKIFDWYVNLMFRV